MERYLKLSNDLTRLKDAGVRRKGEEKGCSLRIVGRVRLMLTHLQLSTHFGQRGLLLQELHLLFDLRHL